jgi:hypothetical protein
VTTPACARAHAARARVLAPTRATRRSGARGAGAGAVAVAVAERRDHDRQRDAQAHEAAQLARGGRLVDAKARGGLVAGGQRARHHHQALAVVEAELRLGGQRAGGGRQAARQREDAVRPVHRDHEGLHARVAHVQAHSW